MSGQVTAEAGKYLVIHSGRNVGKGMECKLRENRNPGRAAVMGL